MLTINNLQDLLKQANLAKVARDTGIHINTIYAIKNGTGNPTVKTLEKLSNYFNN